MDALVLVDRGGGPDRLRLRGDRRGVAAVIVLPALRRGRLTGPGLLAGGAFYAVHLGPVIAALAGAA